MAVHGNNGRLSASSSIHKQNLTTPMYMRSSVPPPLPQHQHHHQQHQTPLPPPHYSYGNPTYGHLAYQPSGGGQHHVYTTQYTTSTAYWSTATASSVGGGGGGGSSNRSDAMMYRHCRPHTAKRKSAVELLAETKPFYVKSDSVIEHLTMGYVAGDNGLDHQTLSRERKFVSPSKMHQVVSKGMSGPQHMHHHHHHHGHHGHGRHAPNSSTSIAGGNHKMGMGMGVGGGGQLACNKLNRRGLENERYCRGDLKQLSYDAGVRAQAQLPTTAIAYRNEPEEPPLMNVAELPPTLSSLEDIYKLSDENSGGEEPLVLTENYRPISPPAEYAAETISMGNEGQHRSSGRYQRSYSHSQEADIVAYAAAATYNNINSHKSLPDLHTHINRQSPHSEILSCCSRGTSINRDSGGSSGHYTHRSEPCYQRQQREAAVSSSAGGGGDHHVGGYLRDMRRDSGSSTQHSEYISPPSYAGVQHGGSGGGVGIGDSMECHCKNPIQFEAANNYEYFGNFPTPEVPKAFQDDYSTMPKYSGYGQHQQQQQQHYHHHNHGGANYYYTNSGDAPHSGPTPPSPQQHQLATIDDISPPPIQFKRQRCIRFKNRQRIPLPGGANVATYPHPNDSMEYYHKQETSLPPLPPPPMQQQKLQQQQQHHQPQPQVFIFPKYLPTDSNTHTTRLDDHQHHHQQAAAVASSVAAANSKEYDNDSEHMGQLERFFDRLGLNEAKFHEIYSLPKRKSTTSSGTGTATGTNSDSDDSTVFFSDVSTVDSMRLPDSTETQPQATQSYRLSEPPSIVERNARIIKWLCNCKKMQ